MNADDGHTAIKDRTVFVAWSFVVGGGIPDDFSTCSELPPFVHHKLTASGLDSPAPLDIINSTLADRIF